MSEANIPPTSGSPESAPQAFPVDDSLTSDVWQDWQTVDLPNSLNVDALAAPTPAADTLAAPASADAPPAAEAQVNDLIELIQQLNECNTQLLDRVEQLEGAIEHHQTDLQAEIAQHQEALAAAEAKESQMQVQMTQLMQQLEFSHQSNQRQQILVETLTEQLENSQERIAQLERECSIAQQRCGEQAQKIVEVETTCRDLQIRLQRQQRYTMQFKVALNKCLDVPAPCYEAEFDRSLDPLPAPYSLLPKLASIQPWSAQPQFPELDPTETLPQLQRLRSIDPTLSAATSSDLSPALSEWVDEADTESIAPTLDADIPSPELIVEPPTATAEPTVIETIEITADMLRDLSEPPAEVQPAADDDSLWQDLARLIEVSTEDVVRAVSAEDFTEFAQQIAAEPDWEPARAEVTPPAPELPAPPPELPATESIASDATAPIVKSNWPSPVVYPLRPPTRKRASLAAVELPSFPR